MQHVLLQIVCRHIRNCYFTLKSKSILKFNSFISFKIFIISAIHLHITSEENQPKNDILHELGDFYKGKRTGCEYFFYYLTE